MPLPKRCVEPVHVSRGTVPERLPVLSELEAVTNGTLANTVRQLSSLSKHAEDMFGELTREATNLAERTNVLQARIDRLAVKVTQLDSGVEEVSLQDIQMRKAFRSSRTFQQQLFSRNSMPSAMLATYARCDRPPPLEKLNEFRDDGRDARKFYTDPDYFFELWRREMLQVTERIQHDRGKKVRQPRSGSAADGRGTRRVRAPHSTRERQRAAAVTRGEHIMAPAQLRHYNIEPQPRADTLYQCQHFCCSQSMIQLKERKEMDEAFKKAQKPWAKLLQKVERTRLEYHTACKQERTAQNQERNAGGDSSLSPDQVKKMADRVSKCRDEVAKTRDRYHAALAEITAYNPRYIEDMSGVFERCQDMEAQRLTFFKDVLFSFHRCLNISQEPILPQIYEEFHHTINNADHQKDLKWWANNHGVNMAMAWPQFEEYTEEFRDIAKGKSKESLPTGPITLLNQRPVSEDELPPITNSKGKNHEPPPPVVANNSSSANNTIDKKTISAPIAVTNGTTPGTRSNKSSPAKESKQENPFEEEEWDEESGGPLTDTGEPGVPVRALYDYTGAESDELTFRQGDQFEKLEDEDEQGWCKGRKDGRVGLYPANYVEPVGH